MADMMNMDFIKEHLRTDGNLAGQEVTPDNIAASIVKLLQELLTPSSEAKVSANMEVDNNQAAEAKQQQERPEIEEGKPAKRQIVTDGNPS